jgi:hypothetical protein
MSNQTLELGEQQNAKLYGHSVSCIQSEVSVIQQNRSAKSFIHNHVSLSTLFLSGVTQCGSNHSTQSMIKETSTPQVNNTYTSNRKRTPCKRQAL